MPNVGETRPKGIVPMNGIPSLNRGLLVSLSGFSPGLRLDGIQDGGHSDDLLVFSESP